MRHHFHEALAVSFHAKTDGWRFQGDTEKTFFVTMVPTFIGIFFFIGNERDFRLVHITVRIKAKQPLSLAATLPPAALPVFDRDGEQVRMSIIFLIQTVEFRFCARQILPCASQTDFQQRFKPRFRTAEKE